MKTLHYLIIAIFVGFGASDFLNAQEVENPPEELTDQTWYLSKMIIDEEEMPFTPNEEIENVELAVAWLNGNNITSAGFNFCAGPVADLVLEGENEFYIGMLMFLANKVLSLESTNSYCDLEENIILEDIYFYEFWNNSELYLGHEFSYPFHFYYTINQLEEHKELIVINDNGDEAHFQNVPYMSVDKLKKSNLTLYPNPVKDHLYIENLTEKIQLEIYDLSGKKLFNQEINNSSESVNVSQLSEGIYLYQFSQNGRKAKTGKLVKN